MNYSLLIYFLVCCVFPLGNSAPTTPEAPDDDPSRSPVLYPSTNFIHRSGASKCPFSTELQNDKSYARQIKAEVASAMKNLDYGAVRLDLLDLMEDSKDWWPADYGHYGPFLIRLAWHSSGSYRRSDGRGGPDGGRIRFEPELSWDDNVNLEKARNLLWPIKIKYGSGLSWGDLIILSGNSAIESMGGKTLGFCGGRVDEYDGSESDLLGPTEAQEDLYGCEINGACKEPLGPSTIGLIYVNPEGPLSVPNPKRSAAQIREVFARMNMNDSETVALIGGGHAFGKTHGPCPKGPGPTPKENAYDPWPGMCGTGRGEDTFTSGFEFPWTTNPIVWDNEYFKNLLQYYWKLETGPGGRYQWKVNNTYTPLAPSAGRKSKQPIGMLTTDLALLHDPSYYKLVVQYSRDALALEESFKYAWYKLTTRDMGPATRCLGSLVPPSQDWQHPLPDPHYHLADFELIEKELETMLKNNKNLVNSWLRLAWRCAATFRVTDYSGGCNGARIRFSPQKDWPVNSKLDNEIRNLVTIKTRHGSGLSWADLIVFAGNTAMNNVLGSKRVPFCGGRTDADDDHGAPDVLRPKLAGDLSDRLPLLKETARIMGLTQREFAVLNAVGYAVGAQDCKGLFCRRQSGECESRLSNVFFTRLLHERWELLPGYQQIYKSVGKEYYMLPTDILYKNDGELAVLAEDYAVDNQRFLTDVAKSWNKLMTADRFDGPTGNLCRE